MSADAAGPEDTNPPQDQGGEDELFADPAGSSANVPETPPDQPEEPDGAAAP